MIRTVWLAFACLIGLAALTVVKVGTKSFVDQSVLPSQETIGTNLQSDVSAKGDRLDQIYPDDAPNPVKSITIVPKIAEPTPKQLTIPRRRAGMVRMPSGKSAGIRRSDVTKLQNAIGLMTFHKVILRRNKCKPKEPSPHEAKEVISLELRNFVTATKSDFRLDALRC